MAATATSDHLTCLTGGIERATATLSTVVSCQALSLQAPTDSQPSPLAGSEMFSPSLRIFLYVSLSLVALAVYGQVFYQAVKTGYTSAILIVLFLAVYAASKSIKYGNYQHLGILFATYILADILKKIVFIIPAQDPVSQYLVVVFPHLFFFACLLIPFYLHRGKHPAQPFVLIHLLILVFLFSTWISPGYTITAKLTASAYLVMPWLLVVIVPHLDRGIDLALRTIVILGIASSGYAVLQTFVGPTPIETNWATNVAGFSIGANHLLLAAQSEGFALSYWRPGGFQADALTLGVLAFTGIASALLLADRNLISRRFLFVAITLLFIGLAVCLVRSVWAGFAVFTLFVFLFYRFNLILKPKLIITVLLAGFFLSQQLFAVLHSDFFLLNANADTAFFARALTTGTLAARLDGGAALLDAIFTFPVFGLGGASAAIITSKFSGTGGVGDYFDAHNFLVEMVYQYGAVGTLLVLYFLYRTIKQLVPYSQTRATHNASVIVAGYIIAMTAMGLAAGSAFLNFYFFLFCGIAWSAHYWGTPRA